MKSHIHTIVGIGKAIGFLLAFCLMIGPCSLYAGTFSEMDVRSAVQTWVHSVTADARPDAYIERMEPYEVEGELRAYIAHLSGGGYCLCGADEVVLPVYLYCPRGKYDPGNPACRAILSEIAARARFVREGVERGDARVLAHQQRLSERSTFWRELVSGMVPRRSSRLEGVLAEPDSMSLPLTCQWGQGSPYNDQCPNLTPGADERTLVGCVATAISQIMYYWKWPNTGVGTHTGDSYDYRWRADWDEEPLSVDPSIPSGWTGRLEWTSASGGRLRMSGYWEAGTYSSARNISAHTTYREALDTLYNHLTSASTTTFANFGATTFQWSLVQDDHSDPVDAGDNAAATLCYQVAVAVDMEFGRGLSLSDLWRAVDPNGNRYPLVNNFRYDADAYYGHDSIATRVTRDIQWLRPVAFSGSGTIGGHAWVLYGYNKGTDPDRQFKMNMGWSGSSDGWYSLDNVPGGLTENHGYLIYVSPQDVVAFVGNITSGDGSPLQPHAGIETAATAASSGATLIFKAGSVNTFTAPLTISKAMTLKGRDATIRAKQ
jgi:hypothetical protein